MYHRPMPPAGRTLLVGLLGLAMLLGACGIPAATVRPPGSAAASPAFPPPATTSPFAPGRLPSAQLSGAIDPERIRGHLDALQAIADAHGGVRAAGTPGYDASVEYVMGELEQLGYEVSSPSLVIPSFRELPGATVSVAGGPTFSAGDEFRAMIYSAGGQLTAPVATIGFLDSDGGAGRMGCAEDDWEEFPDGAIALAPPGRCLRRDVVLHAQTAGAAALVMVDPEWRAGEALRPTLLHPDGIEIPVLAAIGEVGDALSAAARAWSEVTIEVETRIRPVTVRNVIAESGGEGGRLAMVGGHLDSALDGPGINDNGSGVAAMLEIARALSGSDHAGTIRFAFWAAEELGLHGSRDYVEQLHERVGPLPVAYLNLDMLGSVNGAPIVNRDSFAAEGSEVISDFLIAWLQEHGAGAEGRDLGGGSDHYFFAQAGIPTGGIFSGAGERLPRWLAERYGGTQGQPMDPCYHRSCDTADNVDPDRVALHAEAAAHALLLLARGDLDPGTGG